MNFHDQFQYTNSSGNYRGYLTCRNHWADFISRCQFQSNYFIIIMFSWTKVSIIWASGTVSVYSKHVIDVLLLFWRKISDGVYKMWKVKKTLRCNGDTDWCSVEIPCSYKGQRTRTFYKESFNKNWSWFIGMFHIWSLKSLQKLIECTYLKFVLVWAKGGPLFLPKIIRFNNKRLVNSTWRKMFV